MNEIYKFKIYHRVRVAKSKIHGFGAYAIDTIPGRKKIGSLAGEIISKKEAYRKISKSKTDSIAIVELWNGMAMDASTNSNELRYINHSCAPNAYLRVCGYHVEFYALRDISPEEEITCNYGETHHEGTKKCTCGSENCKGAI